MGREPCLVLCVELLASLDEAEADLQAGRYAEYTDDTLGFPTCGWSTVSEISRPCFLVE